MPLLTITKSHTGNFTAGQLRSGDACPPPGSSRPEGPVAEHHVIGVPYVSTSPKQAYRGHGYV